MTDDRDQVGLHITSDPDTTSIEQPRTAGAREVPRLPLRLLLASDLAPEASVDWSEEAGGAHVHRVDANTFGALFQTLDPRLTLEVPNRLSATPKQLDVTLGFTDLKSFRPARVAEQVPALAPLVRLRGLVTEVQAGVVDLPTFRERLAEAGVEEGQAQQVYEALQAPPPPKPKRSAAPPPAGDGDALDRLLGMVDVAGESGEAPAADSGHAEGDFVDAFVGAIAGAPDGGPRVEPSAAAAVVEDLDRRIAEQLGAVFDHPSFRRLEAAWRGLKFVVDRLDFRRGVTLEVLAARKERLAEALYRQVLLPEHERSTDQPPLSALLLDYAFDHSAADVELLEDLAETGASLQAPLVASAAPAFFGVETYAGLGGLSPLWQHLERPEYIAFNKLRDRRDARHLALALPAFLLRPAYDAEATGDAPGVSEAEGVWGGAALAVGVAMASSFVGTGWPTHLTGPDRRIEDLPVAEGSGGAATPLAVLIPESKLSDFGKAGFVVLSGAANRDYAFLARANTLCRPESYEDLMAATEARVHVTLACQLFVARAAQHVLVLQEALVASDDPAALAQEAHARLRAFLHTEGQTVPPDAVAVEHAPEGDGPEHTLLAVRLRTPRYVLERPVSLVMGLRVPKAPAA